VRGRGRTSRAGALAFCATALISIALPAAGTGSPGGAGADALRARQAALAQRSHEALLGLYSLETDLVRARARIRSLDRGVTRLRGERRNLLANLRIVRKTRDLTQKQLADRARSLYESHEEQSVLAIVFGSSSLREALDKLDTIEQISSRQNAILRQTSNSISRLGHLRSRLDSRVAELQRLRSDARSSAQRLESARAARAAYIRGLSNEQALTQRQLRQLSQEATTAARVSQRIESGQVPSGGEQTGSEPTTTTSEPSPGPVTKGGTMTVSSTCYCLRGNTASGLPVGPGIAATDPTVIPMGTRFSAPGYGNAVAADTGSAVKGATIDLWVADCAKASAWGRQTVTITFL